MMPVPLYPTLFCRSTIFLEFSLYYKRRNNELIVTAREGPPDLDIYYLFVEVICRFFLMLLKTTIYTEQNLHYRGDTQKTEARIVIINLLEKTAEKVAAKRKQFCWFFFVIRYEGH